MKTLQGQGVSRGIAFGRLQFYNYDENPGIERRPVMDAAAEITLFEEAVQKIHDRLDLLYEQAVKSMGTENAEVFQIHQMMLEDPDFTDAICKTIEEECICAPYAVQEVGKQFAEMFAAMDDPYMKGRSADVLDISRQIINELLGREENAMSFGSEPVILAADDLAPSQTARLDTSKVIAFVTAKGSMTSHTAIFARTMGIPAIVGLGDTLDVNLNGMDAAVDGETGALVCEPDEATQGMLKKKLLSLQAKREQEEQFRGKSTQTADGQQIRLCANVGGLEDIKTAVNCDAEGVGLLRSEFLYLQSTDYPDEDTLFHLYRAALERMNGKQVIIRTLDIGADKQASYFHLKAEENPAMGLRAIRICLTQQEVFKTQLRAIYRASTFGNAAIMFPMITSAEEVIQAKKIAAAVREELTEQGVAFNPKTPIGIMIETPAAAVLSDELAKVCDFFSVGTNDLTQYTLAMDRMNAELTPFHDPRNQAVLRLIEIAAKNAHAQGIWIGICGELGADEALLPQFLSMKIDELSVTPGAILSLRAKIAGLSTASTGNEQVR